jgi:RNA polymerase sigma factor (sigma-70 family)
MIALAMLYHDYSVPGKNPEVRSMAFEELFVDRRGCPLHRDIVETLVTAVTDILLRHRDADPDVVLSVATRVGQRATESKIDDLYRYTQKSVVRQLHADARRNLYTECSTMQAHSIETYQSDLLSDDGQSTTRLELDILIRECFAVLNDVDRKVLLLYEYKGFDHAEVAASLNISVANCWFRLHRAKKKLKRLLMPYVNQTPAKVGRF